MLNIEDNKFYFVGELAEMLGISKKTVWLRVRVGMFPPLQGVEGTRNRGYWGKDIKKMFGYYTEE
ncbi:TPA: helix-turn-helix transcriptional regulator [Neisseria lactamica]|uniref:Multidrug transporter n=1 Tax=Neisseria lactamica TaxID=486 RepID=A0AAU8VF42_NEILA|nr:hypothetical protein [Neisseria lactamica]ARB03776.1 multidrug transporter [Neisseria lactamica]CBX22239.1 unnamed protein product [Neisseria lactamica Y92-1009]